MVKQDDTILWRVSDWQLATDEMIAQVHRVTDSLAWVVPCE
jgi:hypothetical protein